MLLYVHLRSFGKINVHCRFHHGLRPNDDPGRETPMRGMILIYESVLCKFTYVIDYVIVMHAHLCPVKPYTIDMNIH